MEVLNFRRVWLGFEAGFVGWTGNAGLLGKRVPSIAHYYVCVCVCVKDLGITVYDKMLKD